MLHKPIIFIALLISIALLNACSLLPAQTSRPSVIISAPSSGSMYSVGEQVVVQSTASDPARILRVELIVDGVSVRQDSSPVATGQEQFSLLQSWTADRVGQRNLIVRATNAQGVTSESGIYVTVQENALAAPATLTAAPATAIPTLTDLPTATPPPTQTANPAITVIVTATGEPTQTATANNEAASCTNNAAFVADVTIPDGTNFSPNAAFTKTWRVRNTGTCVWLNYSLVFGSGTQMAANATYPILGTAPGATTDISLPMTAPATSGNYTGTWRLRNASGTLFGNSVTVLINVAAPNTAANPTAVNATAAPAPTLPAATACSGQPNNFTFTASKASVTAGQSVTLNWGAVSNASIAVLNGGQFSNQGVGAPGNITASPTTTTTYTLTATCSNGGGARTNSVTVTVSGNPPPAAACSGTPAIDSFTPSSTTINSGQSVLLTWQTTNADQVRLTGGNLAGGVVAANSSIFDAPSGPTVYRLSALCTANGLAAARQLTVNVVTCTLPSIGSFTASSNSINVGQSVTLSWSGIPDGKRVLLRAGNEPGVEVAQSGSQAVSPATTTTYTLRVSDACVGAPRQVEKSVTVTVNAPACSGSIGNFFFHGSSGAVQDAQILTIKPGESVSLEWGNITNADRIRFVGGGIDVDVGAPGIQVVTPTVKTTYDLTASCSANGNSIHGSVTVDVKP